MKLYTLEYDCNLPVTQQVNVATNTDAKIGIKVKKNGEYLSLDGSTLSVVTPEVITPEPSELLGPGYKITKSPLPFPAAYALMTPLSSVVGAKVYGGASNFSVDISQDNETWSDYDWTAAMTISYRDLDISPNIIATCRVSQGATQWTWVGGPLSGQTTDTVPATEKSRVDLNFSDTDVSAAIATNPAYFRLNCIVHEPPYHATIPADEELTNGYMTFPITTPDTASYVQDTVVVNKEHAFEDTVVQSGQFPAQEDPTVLNPGIFQLKASDVGAVGAVVTADQIGKTALKQWRSSNPLPSEISAWNDSTWLIYDECMGGWLPDIVIVEGHFDGTTVVGKEIYCKPKDNDPTKLEFAEKVPGTRPAQWKNKSDTYTLTKDTIFVRTLNFTSNYYYGQAIPFVLGGPTKATFKLNVNTFKSQQGDKEYIGELPYIPTQTINIAGTYTDNTPFSYDVFIDEEQ